VAYAAHGPVWERETADGEALLGAILDALRETARQQRSIVVKLDPRGEAAGDTAGGPAAVQAGAELRRYGLLPGEDLQAPTTRIVNLLDGGDALMASWHADARRLSRRAEREGVEVSIDRAADAQAVGAFAELLRVTADRSDFRARSEEFLQLLAQRFAERRGWYLGLARVDGVPIAGMAMPRLGDRAYYLYGASLRDPAYKHKYGPYAVMAALQRALAADGVQSLDMWGVVEPGDPDADPAWEGFSAFKRTFGGTPLRHPGLFDLVTDPFWYRLRELRQRLVSIGRR
jgi:lipid II:glycine glycyltransferase (peptidoglycan interpeptide bridge formation enzyme)